MNIVDSSKRTETCSGVFNFFFLNRLNIKFNMLQKSSYIILQEIYLSRRVSKILRKICIYNLFSNRKFLWVIWNQNMNIL